MPLWTQVVTWVLGGLVAVTVIWRVIFRPLIRAVSLGEQLLPLLQAVAKYFVDNPDGFKTLSIIAEEFKPDTGKSLRDVVDRLEKGLTEAQELAETVRITSKANEEVSTSDRAMRTMILAKVEALSRTLDDHIRKTDAATAIAGVAKAVEDATHHEGG